MPTGGLVRTESSADGEWLVRRVAGSAGSAGKVYRCPGCEQLVPATTPHIAAWPAPGWGDVEDRRHWHATCWAHRGHRRPGGRRY